ncbi:MAG: hypothetical protein VX663_03855 [Pseudomonadota bacterium]|nr:hypothetical protein [Pseudomonadota bacterium]
MKLISKGRVRSLLGVLALAGVFAAGPAMASVEYPKVQVISLLNDLGAVQSRGNLYASGSLTNLLQSGTEMVTFDEPYDNFVLTAANQLEFLPGQLWRYVGGGQVCIGASCAGDMTSGELLTGNFLEPMTVAAYAHGVFPFWGDIDFTGGSLVEGIDRGRIVGFFFNLPNGFSGDFSSAGFVAHIGPVNAIPLPSAVWLLMGALPLVARFRRV